MSDDKAGASFNKSITFRHYQFQMERWVPVGKIRKSGIYEWKMKKLEKRLIQDFLSKAFKMKSRLKKSPTSPIKETRFSTEIFHKKVETTVKHSIQQPSMIPF